MSSTPVWLDGARLAPSAHNTQPWRFTPLGDGRTLVRWDPNRALPVSDPTGRDLYLGLGAAIEAARLRSAEANRAALRFTPAEDQLERTVGWLEPADEAASDADRRLASLLFVRQTGRTPHLRRPLPDDVARALADEARQGGCELRIARRPAQIRRLAKLAGAATAAQLADAAVHAELWQWLRLDSRDPAYARDGLTAECMELRGISLAVARLVLPPPRMRRLVRFGLHHLVTLDTRQLVERSASLCLLVAPSSRGTDLVAAGRVLLRLWLLASSAGLRSHPVSALLDCAATIGPATVVFGASDGTAAALFRLGFTPPVARAPRLPAAELIEPEGATVVST